MGQPAARLTDMHVCPMQTPGTPPIPHVGGPIVSPGAPTVLIGNLPAARATDTCVCVGPPDIIVKASLGVFIVSLPAARIGDTTAHGGKIVAGWPTVLIGDKGGGGGGGIAGMVQAAIATGVAAASEAAAAAVATIGLLTTGEQLAPAQEQAQALKDAAAAGAPFCQRCAEEHAMAVAMGLL